MTILITGASGFVGLNVLEQLLRVGHSVLALSTRPLPDETRASFAVLPGRLLDVVADVRDRRAVEDAMRVHAVERVLHLAAITSAAERERVAPEETISVNLGGLACVLTAAASCNVKRFVYASSIGVYGTTPLDGEILTETRPVSPVTLYGITKAAGEDIALRLADLHAMDLVIGRLGVVFGPYEYDTGVRDTLSPVYYIARRALAGLPVTLPRPARKNWQYARDAAACLVTLLTTPTPRHRLYNLGPEPVWTLADWCGLLAEQRRDFQWSIGDADGKDIGLFNPRDGGLLSGERFAEEFGPTASFDLVRAFADYWAWLQNGGDTQPAPGV